MSTDAARSTGLKESADATTTPPTGLDDTSIEQVDEALAYARSTKAARKATGLDTAAPEQWIDTLLDMRHALTS